MFEDLYVGLGLPLPLILLLVAICVFTIFYLWVDKILHFIHEKSLGQRDEIVKYLELMFVEVDHKKLTIAMFAGSFGLGSLFLVLFWPNVVAGLMFGSVFTALGWSLPKVAVKYLYEQRCNRFTDQMVDGMTILANGVRAGLSVTQAMDRIVKNLDNPISQEFRLVLSQNQLGQTIEDALTELGERIPRPDVQMFVTSVNILKETGGNMAETFQTITFTIRERQKIEKKIEALTAQGIMQGIIISSVPFILLGVFFAVDPNYVMPLFTTTLGLIAFMVVIALQIMGGLMIKKIVSIKV
ncbi:MAG: type II secretion system F family protein [Bdellovibrionales bacterium]|nr:type II secretion system F family protein [Bdellovibrionales bacterium]NQZ18263.1 type II secretion system F family protein [Bdellovibrionales bacterium]